MFINISILFVFTYWIQIKLWRPNLDFLKVISKYREYFKMHLRDYIITIGDLLTKIKSISNQQYI